MIQTNLETHFKMFYFIKKKFIMYKTQVYRRAALITKKKKMRLVTAFYCWNVCDAHSVIISINSLNFAG